MLRSIILDTRVIRLAVVGGVLDSRIQSYRFLLMTHNRLPVIVSDSRTRHRRHDI